jgi:hypothetical protein
MSREPARQAFLGGCGGSPGDPVVDGHLVRDADEAHVAEDVGDCSTHGVLPSVRRSVIRSRGRND